MGNRRARKQARTQLRYGIGQRKISPNLASVRKELLDRGLKNPDAWISVFGLKVPEKPVIIKSLPRQQQIPTAYMLEQVPEWYRDKVVSWCEKGLIKPEHIETATRAISSMGENATEDVARMIGSGEIKYNQVECIAETLGHTEKGSARVAFNLLRDKRIAPEMMEGVSRRLDFLNERWMGKEVTDEKAKELLEDAIDHARADYNHNKRVDEEDNRIKMKNAEEFSKKMEADRIARGVKEPVRHVLYEKTLPVAILGMDKAKTGMAVKALRSALKLMGDELAESKSGGIKVPARGTMTKKEIIKNAIETKTYVPELEELLAKDELSYAEINEAIRGIRAQAELASKGAGFGAKITASGLNPEVEAALVVVPTEHEIKTVKGKRGIHMKDSLAYLRFYPKGDALVVGNLQSQVSNVGLPAAVRKRYEKSPEVLLSSLEDYAKKRGYKRILITPANWQLERWKDWRASALTIDPIYTALPKKHGFALKEEELEIEKGHKSKLWWEKKIRE
jgi:hypothetical protein